MCRWVAYSGEPIHPSGIILDFTHSLVAQSLNSPLGAETVNGDGFGLGWYPDAPGEVTTPAVFRSTEPAWNDQNLRELATHIRSPLFFGHVRAAAHPPIQQTNCHPFRYENWLFMHNGAIEGFAAIKRELTFLVDAELYPEIQGTTDTEVLFYLALTYGLRENPIAGLGRAIRKVEEIGIAAGITFPMQGTVAVSDGHTIWAFRYSSEHRTRSLFHSADIETLRELYPDVAQLQAIGLRARVVVSEPLVDLPGAFIEVPESTVAIVDGEGYRHEPFLADGNLSQAS